MMPTLAPTKAFSARWQRRAIFLRGRSIAGGAEDGEGGGDFDGRGGTEAGAERNVAGDGEGEAAGDGDAVLAQGPEDAGGIVGPGLRARAARSSSMGLVDVLVEVDGVGEDAAVGARGDGDEGGEVDGGGHDEAVAVVGVLADEVDAAGRGEELARGRSRWRSGGRRVRRVFAWGSSGSSGNAPGAKAPFFMGSCEAQG